MTRPAMKSCPFCGGSPILYRGAYIDQGDDDYWSVCCSDCSVDHGFHDRPDVAVTAWNKRAHIDRLLELLIKHCPAKHSDWREILKISKELSE